MDTISLCMITKDEEDFFPQCLDSVKTLVDEIVIVDTGSTDKTVAIAKSYGAKIYHHPWENDYSKHRNQSITYATGDWILIMDADEVIAERDRDKIKALLSSTNADGFLFTLRNYESTLNLANVTVNPDDYEEGRGYPGFIANDLIRLFRNDPAICFTGKVHETVTETFRQAKRTLFNTGIPIHHYGKARKDRTRQKQELYLKLGEERLKDNPHDPMAYKGLADQYLDIGMPDRALEVSNRGMALFPEMVELRFNCGLSLDRLGRRKEAVEEYAWVLVRKPDHLGACHNLAQIYYSGQCYDKAASVLDKGIHNGIRHPAIFFLLGQVYFALGYWDKSLKSIEHVSEIQENYPNINYHKAILFLKKNMPDAAISALEREIKTGGNLIAAYNLLGEIALMLGDTQSAAQFFQKVLSINPNDPTAKAHLEKIKTRLNEETTTVHR